MRRRERIDCATGCKPLSLFSRAGGCLRSLEGNGRFSTFLLQELWNGWETDQRSRAREIL
jgi:hypothetical protein